MYISQQSPDLPVSYAGFCIVYFHSYSKFVILGKLINIFLCIRNSNPFHYAINLLKSSTLNVYVGQQKYNLYGCVVLL
jgi:hypothetical protein